MLPVRPGASSGCLALAGCVGRVYGRLTPASNDRQQRGTDDGSEEEPAKIDVESEAFNDADAAARGFGAGVVDRLADRIGAHAGAGAVFGEPVERGGLTIIPVAQSMWGSGAGTGDSVEDGAGAGGGGGAMTKPLGYIEIRDHGAAFVPLHQPWQDVKLVIAYAFMVLVISRAINRILRG